MLEPADQLRGREPRLSRRESIMARDGSAEVRADDDRRQTYRPAIDRRHAPRARRLTFTHADFTPWPPVRAACRRAVARHRATVILPRPRRPRLRGPRQRRGRRHELRRKRCDPRRAVVLRPVGCTDGTTTLSAPAGTEFSRLACEDLPPPAPPLPAAPPSPSPPPPQPASPPPKRRVRRRRAVPAHADVGARRRRLAGRRRAARGGRRAHARRRLQQHLDAVPPRRRRVRRARVCPRRDERRRGGALGARARRRAPPTVLFDGGANATAAYDDHGAFGGACDDGCACDPRGVGGRAAGCAAHHDENAMPTCYVAAPARCAAASPSAVYPGHAWRACEPRGAAEGGAAAAPPPAPAAPPALLFSAAAWTSWVLSGCDAADVGLADDEADAAGGAPSELVDHDGGAGCLHRPRLLICWAVAASLLLVATLVLGCRELRADKRFCATFLILFLSLTQLVSTLLFLAILPSPPPADLLASSGDAADPAGPFFAAAAAFSLLAVIVAAAWIATLVCRGDLLEARASLETSWTFSSRSSSRRSDRPRCSTRCRGRGGAAPRVAHRAPPPRAAVGDPGDLCLPRVAPASATRSRSTARSRRSTASRSARRRRRRSSPSSAPPSPRSRAPSPPSSAASSAAACACRRRRSGKRGGPDAAAAGRHRGRGRGGRPSTCARRV